MQRAAETQEWVANISRQAAFTRGYSPLSAAILDCLGGWIAAGPGAGDEVEALRRRFFAFVGARTWDNDLEPILKLAATLHSHVLRGELKEGQAALRKQLFHIAEAQHEPEVEPHCVADDRWWETVPFERNSAHLPCPTTGAANGAAGARLAFA